MKTALVIPTIREECITKFLDQWDLIGEVWDNTIVVEDNPHISFDINLRHHYSWEEINADLKDHAWIISHRDSSIRSYGFLKAYQLGADVIFTMDDDCYPVSPTTAENLFTIQHLNNLFNTPKWIESVPGQRTRGLPYKNLGTAKNVVMSVGLWEGVPDFDAVQTLAGRDQNIKLPETRVLPMGQYVPICGMNMAFTRHFAPACYFPLQGEGYPFRRFDDIWMGVVAKKIADHLGLMVTMGRPFIHHTKASDPFTNLVKEAPGIKYHENFWEMIDGIPLAQQTPLECMNEIGIALTAEKDDYAKKLGEAIQVWCYLFQSRE